MSKNLENEYRQHMNTEIPDLWARIESALPEKNNDSTEKIVEFSNKSNVKNVVKKKKTKAKVISIVSGLVVAAAAAVIIIPSVLNGNLSKSEEKATVKEKSEKSGHKKDKADKKSSKKDLDSVQTIFNEDSNFFDAFADSDYSNDSAGAAMDNAIESVASEEEMYEEASDSGSVQNSVNAEKSEDTANIKLDCYFIRQYDSDGEINFDNKGLTKTINEIKKNGDICITIDDIKSAEAVAYNNDNGITEYAVNIQFRDAEKWRKITEAAAKNNECIAIYYNGKIISAPRVMVAITGGNAQINGLESYEEAESIVEAISN